MTEAKKSGMRVKDVGATINLGNYSSLHVTIGEEQEYAGLDIGRAEKYLRKIAESVDGVLNLPDSKKGKDKTDKATSSSSGVKMQDVAGSPVFYDNNAHAYFNDKHVRYNSVTQLVGSYYPFNADGVIAQEYMDFAANFGNLIHTSVQNALIGKAPKKKLIKHIVEQTLEAMGHEPDSGVKVEQILVDHTNRLAGRFDILTTENGKNILWDVKTNSNLYAKANCNMPPHLKGHFSQRWNPDTVFGEHCLQLNIYADILERVYGIRVDAIKIIHIPDEFSEIVDVPQTDVSQVFLDYNSRS